MQCSSVNQAHSPGNCTFPHSTCNHASRSAAFFPVFMLLLFKFVISNSPKIGNLALTFPIACGKLINVDEAACLISLDADIAQLVERLIRNQQIVSSNLTGGSIISRVYVQQLHINPCFVFGLQRKIWRKIPKIPFYFSELQNFLIYPIYTLAVEGSLSGNSEQKTLPLFSGIFPFFSSLLRHTIHRISSIHAGLRAEFFYPISTLSYFGLFARLAGMRGAR